MLTDGLRVNQHTLQHVSYANIFSLGDVSSTPNAKTMAAARKQVVIAADNIVAFRAGQALPSRYDGYGSCPLTVEKGKIILAEFGLWRKTSPQLFIGTQPNQDDQHGY